MKTIKTMAELGEQMARIDAASAVSDAHMRAVFGSFKMDYPEDIPDDPYSQEYRDYQFDIYTTVSGKHYLSDNEKSHFDIEKASSRPFPFYTGGCGTVRDHLILVANLIGLLDLPVGSKILEFGPGWGNTTLFLAQMDYDVTAIDIEPNFVELIRRRAERTGVTLTANVGAFLDVEKMTETYDAVIFFECFHHCDDHVRLIKGLKSRVNPGGKVIFGAEPITADYPVPWGVRLDGEALWAARSFGWLELGFNEAYFTDLLKRSGWRVQKHVSKDVDWVSYFVATHASEPIIAMEGDDPRILSSWATRVSRGMAASAGQGILCYGPYIAVAAGSYFAEILLELNSVNAITVEIVTNVGTHVVNSQAADIGPATEGRVKLEVSFDLEADVTGLEVRISCDVAAGGTLTLVSYKILEALQEDMPG